jgi:hypothetical protein
VLDFRGCGSVLLRREHESCCGGKSLTRFRMSQFAIESDACRVTQSKLSHPSLRLVPPQQTRNGSAVTKGHEKLRGMGDGLATRNMNPKMPFSNSPPQKKTRTNSFVYFPSNLLFLRSLFYFYANTYLTFAPIFDTL